MWFFNKEKRLNKSFKEKYMDLVLFMKETKLKRPPIEYITKYEPKSGRRLAWKAECICCQEMTTHIFYMTYAEEEKKDRYDWLQKSFGRDKYFFCKKCHDVAVYRQNEIQNKEPRPQYYKAH